MSRAARLRIGFWGMVLGGWATVLAWPFGRSAEAASLPDSVLATVGPRTITVASFQHAWAETHPGTPATLPTPKEAKGFLEALVDRELIASAATREPTAWTAEDSAHFAAARDRLLLRPALQAALAAAQRQLVAAGDSTPDQAAIGIAAREHAIQQLAPRYEDARLKHMADTFAALPRPSADSSLDAQMRALNQVPQVDASERALPLATTAAAGSVTIGDVIDQFAHLQPVYRPRISEVEQVRDLVNNGLFERWLRASSLEAGLDQTPEFQAALARERELIAVRHLMDREIYDPIPEPDDQTLEEFHRTHSEQWTVPARMLVVTLTLPGRHEATALALKLREAAYAETLAARGRRQGARYGLEISAKSDSLLFERAKRSGPGTVVGPDSVAGGWRVARVVAERPRELRAFASVRGEVRSAWHQDQAAARLRALIDRERKRVRVRSNDEAFAEMTDP
jgi:hypothetical protein